MSIDDKIKIQEKYGPIQIKTFKEGNPFGSKDDLNDLYDAITWCNNDLNRWTNYNNDVIVLNRHYNENTPNCLLSVSYVRIPRK